MKYGERLKKARLHKGFSQFELAEKSGVGQGSISKIERGDQDRSTHDLALARVLDVDPYWLSNGDQQRAPEWLSNDNLLKVHYAGIVPINFNNVEPARSYEGKLPLISWINAGAWCEAIDLYEPGDAEEWKYKPCQCSQNSYMLRVVNDSMTSPYPYQRSYPAGMLLTVDPLKDPFDGCRVIAKIPMSNEATFKEYRFDAGKWWLVPLNPRYEKIEFTEEMHICGVVVHAGWDE